jgi:MSHA biogenesis protein MshL
MRRYSTVKFTHMTTKAVTLNKMSPMLPMRMALPGIRLAESGLCIALGSLLLAGCAADRPLRTPDVTQAVRAELESPPAKPVAAVPSRVSDALAEPAPKAAPLPPEPRLDLLVNDAQAREVLLAIVADTRYSMLMHPDVGGKLSVTLRGVTVVEALEAIRDVYGYDFKIEGRRIVVYAPTLQTRVFTINYPHALREGTSELRVTSGSTGNSNSSNNNAANGGTGNTGANNGANGSNTGAGASSQQIGSRVTTSSRTDFWAELSDAVKGMLGGGVGRSVIVSPQAGIMAVRGMPDELRQVAQFLKAAQIAVERQVMLEAKIVEVELRDGFQSGIDWSALRNTGRYTGVVGTVGGGTANNVLVNGVTSNVPGFPGGAAATLADTLSLPGAGGGLFGLAFATDGFQAVLGFLETRGDVQILSSPRIATMNNQKAVLKVGSEDSYIISMTPGVAGTATTAGTPATPKFGTFFSGISLDVTPQIDDGNNITLHVHPSVTKVTSKNLTNSRSTWAPFQLPAADRFQQRQRVRHGGAHSGRQYRCHWRSDAGRESNRTSSGLPGTSDVPLFSIAVWQQGQFRAEERNWWC